MLGACLFGPSVSQVQLSWTPRANLREEGGIPTSVLTTIPQRKWTVIALKKAGDKRGGRRGHLT